MPQQPLQTSYDLAVIGGGSAGVRLARLAAQCGHRVVLIEASHLGGTCVNAGCIPKKLYRYAADYAHAFEEAGGYGWRMPGSPQMDFEHLKKQQAKEVKRLQGVYTELLDEAGVTVIQARAKMLDAHTIALSDGQKLRARHVALAVGGLAKKPDIPGGEYAVTSDAMFNLPVFPRHLVVIGGGYIACEMASIFHGLGARVTLIHRGRQLLEKFDKDIGQALAHQLQAQDLHLEMQAEVLRIERTASSFSEKSTDADGPLHVHCKDGKVLQADVVLYAIGRMPNTQGLGLEEAGVTLDRKGAVVVDAYYRSTAPSIHAIGDVSGQMALTPVALAQAASVVSQVCGRTGYTVDESLVPTAVFTHPEVASVGLTEARAIEQGMAVEIYRTHFTPLRHQLTGQPRQTFMKLVVDVRTDRVLGLHMVGESAAEMIQGFAAAVHAGLTKSMLNATIGIHPTAAEEWMGMRQPDSRSSSK